jgi:SAM-dependent methyltransferase
MAGGYGTHKLTSKIKGPFWSRLMKLLYPPMPTLNTIPASVLEQIRHSLFRPDTLVLNIGAGGISGCGKRLWKSDGLESCEVIHMDIGIGDTINVQGDAHRLPFNDGSVDAVVMQAVLEHLHSPELSINEAWRILRPGGYLYIEMPFLQGYHADPHDYQRYTLNGLRERLKMFTEVMSGVSVGPFCTLVWYLRDALSSCFSNTVLYATSRLLVGWLTSPVRYLDYLVRNNRVAIRLANEYYYLCKKPEE